VEKPNKKRGETMKNEIKLSDFSNRRFLSKEDCDPPILLTVADLAKEDIAADGEPPKEKVVVYWEEEGVKPYASNKTFGDTMLGWFGGPPSSWKGKQIVAYKDDSVTMGGKRVGGIRFRLPRKKPHPPVPIEQPKSDEEEYEY
jgi:hypothetical protein